MEQGHDLQNLLKDIESVCRNALGSEVLDQVGSQVSRPDFELEKSKLKILELTTSLQEAESKLQRVNDEAKLQANSLQKTMVSWEAQKIAVEEELRRALSDKSTLQSQLREISDQSITTRKSVDKLQKENEFVMSQLAEAKAEGVESQQKLSTCESKLTRLQEEIATLKESNCSQDAEIKIAHAENVATLMATIKSLTGETEQLRTALVDAGAVEVHAAELRDQLLAAQAKEHALRRESEDKLVAAQTHVAHLESEIVALRARNRSEEPAALALGQPASPSPLLPSPTAALAASMEAFEAETVQLKADKSHLEQSVAQLNVDKSTLEQAVIQAAARARESEEVLQSLTSERDALLAKLTATVEKEADIDTEVSSTHKVAILTTALRASEEQAMSLAEKLAASEQQHSEAQAKIAQFVDVNKSVEAEVRVAIESLTAEANALKEDKAQLERSVTQLTTDKSTLEQTVAQLNTDKATLEEAVAQAVARARESEEVLQSLTSERDALLAKLAEEATAIVEKEADFDAEASSRHEVAILHSKLHESEEQLASLTTALRASEEQVTSLAEKLAASEQQHSEAQAKIAQFVDVNKSVEAEVRVAIESLTAEANALKEDKAQLERSVTQLTTDKSTLEQAVAQAAARARESEEVLQSLTSERDGLAQRVDELLDQVATAKTQSMAASEASFAAAPVSAPTVAPALAPASGGQRFRKKPMCVRALALATSPAALASARSFCGPYWGSLLTTSSSSSSSSTSTSVGEEKVTTLQLTDGTGSGSVAHVASVGDWLIKGLQGEVYACKPDIFALTYEEEKGQAAGGGFFGPRVYRKRAVEVSALCVEGLGTGSGSEAGAGAGAGADAVAAFCGSSMGVLGVDEDGRRWVQIKTLEDGVSGNGNEAVHVAYEGDWVIRGVRGEYWPVKPSVFELSYEAVPSSSSSSSSSSALSGDAPASSPAVVPSPSPPVEASAAVVPSSSPPVEASAAAVVASTAVAWTDPSMVWAMQVGESPACLASLRSLCGPFLESLFPIPRPTPTPTPTHVHTGHRDVASEVEAKVGMILRVPGGTSEATVRAGDWVVKSREGDVYGCGAATFSASYARVEGGGGYFGPQLYRPLKHGKDVLVVDGLMAVPWEEYRSGVDQIVSTLERKLEATMTERDELEAEAEVLNEECEELKLRDRASRQQGEEQARARARADALEMELDGSKATITSLQRQIASLQGEITLLEGENATVKTALRACEESKLALSEAGAHDAVEALACLQAELQSKADALHSLEQERESLVRAQSNFEATIAQLEGRIAALESQIVTITAATAAAKDETALSKVESEAKEAAAVAAAAAAGVALAEAESKVASLKRKLDQLRDRCERVEEEYASASLALKQCSDERSLLEEAAAVTRVTIADLEAQLAHLRHLLQQQSQQQQQDSNNQESKQVKESEQGIKESDQGIKESDQGIKESDQGIIESSSTQIPLLARDPDQHSPPSPSRSPSSSSSSSPSSSPESATFPFPVSAASVASAAVASVALEIPPMGDMRLHDDQVDDDEFDEVEPFSPLPTPSAQRAFVSASAGGGPIVWVEVGDFATRVARWSQKTEQFEAMFTCPSFAAVARDDSNRLELVRYASQSADEMFQRFRDNGAFVGADAYHACFEHPDRGLRGALVYKPIFANGRIVDFAGFEELVPHCISKAFRGENNTEAFQLLVTFKSAKESFKEREREAFASVLFQALAFRKVCFMSEASLVRNSVVSRPSAALVVDIGATSTRVTPVYEGYSIPDASRRILVGGEHVTDYLALLLYGQQSESYNSLLPRRAKDVARKIKEATAFVAPNMRQACMKYGNFEFERVKTLLAKKTFGSAAAGAGAGHGIGVGAGDDGEFEDGSEGSITEMDEGQAALSPSKSFRSADVAKNAESIRVRTQSRLPDGTTISLEADLERFHCAEVLFDPSMYEDCVAEQGLVEVIVEAATAIDESGRAEICGHVIVGGGSAHMPGMAQRLVDDLGGVFSMLGVPSIKVTCVGEKGEISTASTGGKAVEEEVVGGECRIDIPTGFGAASSTSSAALRGGSACVRAALASSEADPSQPMNFITADDFNELGPYSVLDQLVG